MIDPTRCYTLSEAARLLPPRSGKQTSRTTLYAWRASGKLKCVKLGNYWVVWGSELLRLLGADEPPPPGPPVRTAKQRQRDYEAAVERAKELGLLE